MNVKNSRFALLLSPLMVLYFCSSALAGDYGIEPAQKIVREAGALSEAKRYPDAIRILKQGLADAKKSGNVFASQLLISNLVDLYLKIGDTRASQELLKQVLRDSQQDDDKRLGTTASPELQKAREAVTQNLYASCDFRTGDANWANQKKLLQNLIDLYEKEGRYEDALPSYRSLRDMCFDQYGYYDPETLKVVKAYLLAQKRSPFPVDLVETEKLAIDIEAGLKAGKRGGRRTFCVPMPLK